MRVGVERSEIFCRRGGVQGNSVHCNIEPEVLILLAEIWVELSIGLALEANGQAPPTCEANLEFK